MSIKNGHGCYCLYILKLPLSNKCLHIFFNTFSFSLYVTFTTHASIISTLGKCFGTVWVLAVVCVYCTFLSSHKVVCKLGLTSRQIRGRWFIIDKTRPMHKLSRWANRFKSKISATIDTSSTTRTVSHFIDIPGKKGLNSHNCRNIKFCELL